MELLEKVNKELEELIFEKKAKSKLKKVEWDFLNELTPDNVLFDFHHYIIRLLSTVPKPSSLFNLLALGFNEKKLNNLPEDDKKKIAQLLKKKIDSVSTINYYPDYFTPTINPISERLKLLTQGTYGQIFLSVEEEQVFLAYIKEMACQSVDFIFINASPKTLINAYVAYFKKEYDEFVLTGRTEFQYIREILSANMFIQATDDPILLEELQKIARTLYEKDRFPLFENEKPIPYSVVHPYAYLLNEEEKMALKPLIEEDFHLRFQLLETKDKKTCDSFISRIEKMSELKKELEDYTLYSK